MREQIIDRLKVKFPEYSERVAKQSYVSPTDVTTFLKFKSNLLSFREKQKEIEVLPKPKR
jgi:hypothetical protein